MLQQKVAKLEARLRELEAEQAESSASSSSSPVGSVTLALAGVDHSRTSGNTLSPSYSRETKLIILSFSQLHQDQNPPLGVKMISRFRTWAWLSRRLTPTCSEPQLHQVGLETCLIFRCLLSRHWRILQICPLHYRVSR